VGWYCNSDCTQLECLWLLFFGMLLMNISRLAILRRDILNQLDGVINQLTTARGPYCTIYIEDLTSKHEFLFFPRKQQM
jgi:hypothetical protein